MSLITVFIAEDHTLLREALTTLINQTPRLGVVGEARSGEEAVEKSIALKPRVVLMDINLQGTSGMEATRQIRSRAPGVQVLALSLHTQWPIARQILRKGASGYVTKTSSWSELVEAIFQVAAGARYICKEMRARMPGSGIGAAGGVGCLTPRELEIIALLRQGASSREIACTLHLSVKTVETHRYHILKKLRIRSTAALIDLVHTEGLGG